MDSTAQRSAAGAPRPTASCVGAVWPRWPVYVRIVFGGRGAHKLRKHCGRLRGHVPSPECMSTGQMFPLVGPFSVQRRSRSRVLWRLWEPRRAPAAWRTWWRPWLHRRWCLAACLPNGLVLIDVGICDRSRGVCPVCAPAHRAARHEAVLRSGVEGQSAAPASSLGVPLQDLPMHHLGCAETVACAIIRCALPSVPGDCVRGRRCVLVCMGSWREQPRAHASAYNRLKAASPFASPALCAGQVHCGSMWPRTDRMGAKKRDSPCSQDVSTGVGHYQWHGNCVEARLAVRWAWR